MTSTISLTCSRVFSYLESNLKAFVYVSISFNKLMDYGNYIKALYFLIAFSCSSLFPVFLKSKKMKNIYTFYRTWNCCRSYFRYINLIININCRSVTFCRHRSRRRVVKFHYDKKKISLLVVKITFYMKNLWKKKHVSHGKILYIPNSESELKTVIYNPFIDNFLYHL